jgi:hypothetical protein
MHLTAASGRAPQSDRDRIDRGETTRSRLRGCVRFIGRSLSNHASECELWASVAHHVADFRLKLGKRQAERDAVTDLNDDEISSNR